MLRPPGERRIYRIGSSVFRVWMDEPDAGAEFLKGGDWVWTPIPSGSIVEHPSAVPVRPEELPALSAEGVATLEEPPGTT